MMLHFFDLFFLVICSDILFPPPIKLAFLFLFLSHSFFLGMEQKPSKHKKTIEEVGVDDAPNGGKAAWSVVFGCFCVSEKTFFFILKITIISPCFPPGHVCHVSE